MTEIKRVKISHVIQSQIPEFLTNESPLFVSFLNQYYQSQEHQSGVADLANNLAQYRQIGALTDNVYAGDATIRVTSTTGWPQSYGLLKIDNEISHTPIKPLLHLLDVPEDSVE